MFFERFEKRMAMWREFRDLLETAKDPIQDTINFWNKAPVSSMTCDPFDNTTWLDPWQLIESNDYCEFSKMLAIYYTLALTDRFKNSTFNLSIASDRQEQKLYYLLSIDDITVGYDYFKPVNSALLPSTISTQASYPLDPKMI